MPQYMLMLHERPADFAEFSPEHIQQVIEEFMAWRAALDSKGNFVASAKLRDEGGKHLTGTNGSFRVTDGPYTEAKEVIGGYFTIAAGDYDEAVELSRGCPMLKYGGRIEVREIEMCSDSDH